MRNADTSARPEVSAIVQMSCTTFAIQVFATLNDDRMIKTIVEYLGEGRGQIGCQVLFSLTRRNTGTTKKIE